LKGGARFKARQSARLSCGLKLAVTVVFADFLDSAIIWMVQGGSSLCLKVEAAQCL